MKYLFTLVFALLAGVTTTKAQTVTITKTVGTIVKYKASEIKNIQFANEESATKPIHNFEGYIVVRSAFFFDTYYGDDAKMEVYAQGGKTYCKFTDEKWGTGIFEVTLKDNKITGKGKMSIVDPMKGGAAKEYNAIMAGPMTAVNISVTGLMGSTTIKWRNGKAPETVKLSGTYMGENKIAVGLMGTFTNSNAGHSFWVNDDGTYSIMVLGQQINGTAMGDLTLGAYTINNLVYDEKTETFSKDYSNDGLKMKFKAVKDGTTNMEGDYVLTKANIKATFGKDGALKVENNFTAGKMPFPLTAVFNGKIKK